MKLIQLLTELINDELDDAKKYAELSLQYKEQHPDTAKLFRALSDEEMRHMERLHAAAENVIAEYKRDKGEPPADMLAVYRYVHDQETKRAREIKILQAMYD